MKFVWVFYMVTLRIISSQSKLGLAAIQNQEVKFTPLRERER